MTTNLFSSVRFLEGRADSIAKPFYAFIDVLFDEQNGMLKLIRMTLVQFMRVTYGSTINRQVRRFIVSLFQEEHVVKSLILLRDTFWPEVAPGERPTPTDDEKLERRQEAKRQLLTNIPGRYPVRDARRLRPVHVASCRSRDDFVHLRF